MPLVLTNSGIYLPNNRLLTQYDFPSTTGLYMWPLNGASSFSGANTYGGVDLTGVGIASSTNHLDSTVYNSMFDSTDIMYASNAAFNTSNESYTIYGWFKTTSPGTQQPLASKTDANIGASAYSFQWDMNADQSIRLFHYYNNSNGYVVCQSGPGVLQNDGRFHFCAVTYDQSNTSITLYIDGKIIAYKKDALLSNRNNASNGALAFGNYYTTASPSSPFKGQISEVGYLKNVVLTFAQIRQLYVTGTKKMAYLDEYSKVKINGEIGSLYSQFIISSISDGTNISSEQTLVTQYIPINGKYIIDYHAQIQNATNFSSVEHDLSLKLKVNGTVVDSNGFIIMTSNGFDTTSLTKSYECYLTTANYISFTVHRAYGSTATYYVKNSVGGSYTAPYVRLTKLDN